MNQNDLRISNGSLVPGVLPRAAAEQGEKTRLSSGLEVAAPETLPGATAGHGLAIAKPVPRQW